MKTKKNEINYLQFQYPKQQHWLRQTRQAEQLSKKLFSVYGNGVAFIFIEMGYKQGSMPQEYGRGHLKLVSARKRIGQAGATERSQPPRGDRTRHAAARR